MCYAVKIVGTLLKASCKSSMGNRMASERLTDIKEQLCFIFSSTTLFYLVDSSGMNTLRRLIVANCFQKFFRLKFNRFFLLSP